MQKQRYYLFRRGRVFYFQDAETGEQKSLHTQDAKSAEALFQAKIKAFEQPLLNLALAKVHLAAIDPQLSARRWSDLMQEVVARCAKESTQKRYRRAVRSKPFNLIRERKIVETRAEDLRAVMAAGGVFTNEFLKCLHNLAQGLGWLPWPIIPSKMWPQVKSKPKRAITEEEHNRILEAEKSKERRIYYEVLWETGAAQSDGAELKAENIDWKNQTLSFQRKKTGEWCHLTIGPRLNLLLRQLPNQGPLFCGISQLPDRWRSAEFSRRCRLLKISGISLHSYRYAWAERAYARGIPERFAQAALGHSSKAVHYAYAKHAVVICPSLDIEGDKTISLLKYSGVQSSPSNGH